MSPKEGELRNIYTFPPFFEGIQGSEIDYYGLWAIFPLQKTLLRNILLRILKNYTVHERPESVEESLQNCKQAPRKE